MLYAVMVLPVLLGFAGLMVDVAQLYLDKTRLQSALDLTALAAAVHLPNQVSQATALVSSAASSNGLSDAQVSYSLQPDNKHLLVTASETKPTTFFSFFGFPGVNLSANSIAQLEPIQRSGNVLPMGIDAANVPPLFGNTVTLLLGAGIGSWVPLAPSGAVGDATVFSQLLQQGYAGGLGLGSSVPLNPLALGSLLVAAVQDRINAALSDPRYASGTAGDHLLSDPRAVTIPVVSLPSGVLLPVTAPVAGFVRAWLQDASLTGTGAALTDVQFLQEVGSQSYGSPAAPDYGAYAVQLGG